jgi:hypothetical protein
MPLISPLLWQGLPFKHADGEMDFLGMHDHWHAMLGLGDPGPAVGPDRAVEPVRGPCYKEGAGRRGASGHVPTLQEDQP